MQSGLLQRIAASALTFLALWMCACEGQPAQQGAAHICDDAGVLSQATAQALDARRALLADELGIDLAVVVAESGDLDGEASQWLEALGAGGDGRGVLYAYDPRSGRFRIEVGYALEGVLPDALLGEWIDDHTLPLISQAALEPSFLLTLRMLSDRVRRSEGVFSSSAALQHASGGAGASNLLQEATSRAQRMRPALDRRRFASVETAHAAYLDWLASGDVDARPACFDAASQDFLDRWPLTPGYLEHVHRLEASRVWSVLVAADRALTFPTDDPFLAPHFFRHDGESWRMDLVSEVKEVVSLAGGAHAWGFRSATSPTLAPFAHALVEVDGVLRLRDGENRPVPPVADPAKARAGACPEPI